MKALWMVATACAVLVSGCSRGEPEATPPAPGTPAAVPEKARSQQASSPQYAQVDITTDAGLFWFKPRRCQVGPDADSGVVAYSIEGAGQSPDGQPVYVTIEDEDDDPNNSPEVRINVGTDQPRKTPEVVWIANDGSASSLRVPPAKTTVQGQTLEVQGLVLTRSGEDRLTVQAPVRIDCTRR